MNFLHKFNFKTTYQWRQWHAYFLIALAAVIVYGQSLFFDYSYFDDQQLILENAAILERAEPAEIFFNDVFFGQNKFYYRPLLTWSLVWDWHWGGGTVFAFHFSNIIFHFLAASLLFYLLRLIFVKADSALVLTLIFTVHPALTQAVAWIPGRNDVLAAIFIFSALIFLSRWFRRERLLDLICLWLFFLLALFTKETTALLPFLALLWVIVFERQHFTWFKLGLSAAGATVAGIIWYLARLAALGPTVSGSIWSSLLTSLTTPVVFLGKVFFPVNLSVYPVAQDVIWFYGILAVILLAFLFYSARVKKYGPSLFGLLWFWFFIMLGSSRPDGDIFRNFMEHRLYVPMLGLLIVLAETDNFWRHWPLQRRRQLLAALLFLLSFLAWRHSNNFRDRFSFWQQATESSPHAALAWRNLGAMHYLDGDLAKAENYFRQSLLLNDQEPMAHNNLAVVYLDRGDLWRAEAELKKELAINPGYDLALYNLGRVYYEKQRYLEAASLWREVLRVNPYHQAAAQKLQAVQLKIQTQN